MPNKKPATVDEYILQAPAEAQHMLHELRSLLKEIAPDAVESLKWGNPVFEEKRILFAYAAYKSHLNFIPTRSALVPFEERLKGFVTGKGSIQLPYSTPFPTDLIRDIALWRARDVREHDARWM